MKQTEIGLIPDDWEVKSLGEISDLLTGYPFPGNEIKTDGTYRLLRGINITEGEIRHSEDIDRYYSGDISPLKKYLLQPNDLVIGMDGSKVGKNSAIISETNSNSLLVQRVARLREIKNLSSIEFISQFINSYFFSNYVDSLKTSSAIPHISPANIKNFIVPFPPLTEQQRIAKALSDVDALISTTEKLIQKKKNIKQGTMQNLLTGKKRLPGFAKSTNYKQSELGLIPEDWEVKSLGELGSFKNGISKPSEDFGFGSPFVNLMDIFGITKISETNHLGLINSNIIQQNTYSLKEGDVLFVRSSVKPEGVGLTTVIKKDLDKTVYSGFILRFREVGNELTTDFKEYVFYNKEFRDSLISSSTVSANTNINQPALRKLIIIYPSSKEEQTAIANVLSSMDKEIETLNTKLEKYRNLKTAMMQQLLTGKIRLR